MKGRDSSIGMLLFRAACLLVGGIMISVVILGPVSTNTWFKSRAAGNMEVRAASTEDIIEYIGLKGADSEGKNIENPEYIILKGANTLGHSPMLYFQVEGEIAEYILHINPVRIKAATKHSIPIEPNLNLRQYTELWDFFPWNRGRVEGYIRIKYLNEFIDEKIKVSFTRRYLRSKLLEEIQRREVIESVELTANEEARGEITAMITYLASHLNWGNTADDGSSHTEADSISTSSSDNDLMRAALDEEAVANQEYLQEGVSIERFYLNKEQSRILDVIAPTLQLYLQNGYDLIMDLSEKINEKILLLAELSNQLKDLEAGLARLRVEAAEKDEQIAALEKQALSLKEANELLLQEIQQLGSASAVRHLPPPVAAPQPTEEAAPPVAAPQPAEEAAPTEGAGEQMPVAADSTPSGGR